MIDLYPVMEDLTNHWSSLSLSENEGLGLCLKSEQAANEFGIVAKFLTKRPLNLEAIANTFSPLWRSKVGFKVRNIGDHVILFSFESKTEVERILSAEPWSFDKHIMVLSRYDKENPINVSDLKKVAFWIQVFDIPLRFRKKEIAEQICESVGTILHPKEAGDCEGDSFIRVRALVDISKPLCRGRLITLEDGKTHWVSFKYERLPNLCYWCGCLSHSDRDCERWIESEGSLKPDEQQFGSWLRAPPFTTSRKNVILVKGFFAEKKQSRESHPKDPKPTSSSASEQHTSAESPHPPRPATKTSEKQGSEAAREAILAHKGTFERFKADSSLNCSNLGDFEKIIQDIDSDIQCFDRSVAFSLDQISDIPEPVLIKPSQPAHSTSPTSEPSPIQPTKPIPLKDLTNVDKGLGMAQNQSDGKWVRLQRPAFLKDNIKSDVSLGKRSPSVHLDSPIPYKRRACAGVSNEENSIPAAAADLQPRRYR